MARGPGLLQDPRIAEEDRHGHVDGQDQEHDDGQWKVKNVPIPEQTPEGLQEGDLST